MKLHYNMYNMYEFSAADNQCVSIILISYDGLAELRSSAVSLYFTCEKMVRYSLMCELQLLHVCLQIEVFNILFIREQEKRHVVHCMDCARKQAPGLEGFVCLEEYRMDELCEVFDHFVLHPVVRKKCCNFVFYSSLLLLYWIPYVQPCIGNVFHLFFLFIFGFHFILTFIFPTHFKYSVTRFVCISL